MEEEQMKDFCEIYHLQNLIKETTCFKSVQNPTSIDLILTNKSTSFENSFALETDLSDHHKMVITVLRTSFNKIKPLNISYRSYNHIDLNTFRNDLNISLHACDTNSIFLSTLNKYAPTKSKAIRGINRPFMNKTLSKSFMERSKLKNRYYKFPTENNYEIFKKQRNYCKFGK